MSATILGRGAWHRPIARVRSDSMLRNSAWMIATTGANGLLGYVFWAVAARQLPADAVGLATAVIAAMTFTSVAATVGFGPALVAHLPRRVDDEAWSRTLTAALVAAAVLGTVGGLVVAGVILPALSDAFAPLHDDVVVIGLSALGAGAWSIATVLDFATIAERRAHLMFVRNVSGASAKLGLLAVAIASSLAAVTALVGVWASATIVSVLLAFKVLLPRLARPYRATVDGTFAELRATGAATAWHHVISLGSQVAVYALPVIVVTRASATANAYFSLTWMVGSVFFTVSPAVSASLFAEATHDRARLRSLALRAARTIALLLVGPMALMTLCGPWILGIFGPEYASAGTGLLLVLVASAIPDAVTNIAVATLRVEGRLRLAAALNVSMAVVALGLGWVLVPRLGPIGGGWGWLLAQSAGALAVLLGLATRRDRGAPLAGICMP